MFLQNSFCIYSIVQAFFFFLRHMIWEGKLDSSLWIKQTLRFLFYGSLFSTTSHGDLPIQQQPRKLKPLALSSNTMTCSKGGKGATETLCNPVVVRGLHRPFLGRPPDLPSVPPARHVLPKAFGFCICHSLCPFLMFSAFFHVSATLSLIHWGTPWLYQSPFLWCFVPIPVYVYIWSSSWHTAFCNGCLLIVNRSYFLSYIKCLELSRCSVVFVGQR